MPQIKKVRVANIKYDHNKKQIPDITFDLDEQNTIFLLANGGGKSLLVQLIIQTILPNESMGKRRISDLFESANYTGHVAVEWSLDSEGSEEHLLCTGFCFKEGQGSRSLDYYSYLVDYTASDEFGIASLPLIKDTDLFSKREPIRFQRLKNWLYDLDRQRVEVFDTNYKYQNKLKQYGILAEEWKSIAQTNAAEGGVDDFFARSKNTKQLLNNLLIPQIREVLFSTHEEDKLFEAFDKHRNKLLRMPQIEANIKQFESITNQAEDLIDDVEQLAVLQEEVEDQQLSLVRLGKRFLTNQRAAAKKLESLTKEQEELQAEEEKLHWQKKSQPVFVKKLAAAEVEKKRAHQDEQLRAATEKKDRAEERKRQLQALGQYNKAQQEEEQLKKHQYSLEILNNKAPELRDKLETVEESLACAWQKKEKELVTVEQEKEEKISQLEAKVTEITAKLGSKEERKEELISQQVTLKNWLHNLNQEQENLQEELSVSSLSAPQQVLEAKEDKLAATKEEVVASKEKIADLEVQQEEISEEKVTLKQQEMETKAKLEKRAEQLERFGEQQEEVASMLVRKGKHWSDLLAQQDQVVSFVRDKLGAIRGAKSNQLAEISNLEEKLALVDDKEYYIPHHMLVKIKDFLEEKNIYTVLGSEWLAQQTDGAIDKRGYLKQYPLLPYAILVEERQISKVKRILQRLDLEADFPVALLIRDNLNLAEDELSTNQSVMFYQPESTELFIERESFQQFKDNLETTISEQRKELADLKEEEEFYFELKNKVDSFYQQYQQEKIAELRETKVELKEEGQRIQEELVALEEKQVAVKQDLKQEQAQKTELQAEINSLEQGVEKLKDFADQFALAEEKEEKLKQVQNKLEQLRTELARLKESKEKLQSEISEEQQQLKEIYQRQESHHQEYDEYDLGSVAVAENTDRSYQELKNQRQELTEQLNQKQSKREEIEELINNYRSSYQERSERIAELEVEWDWLENNQRTVSRQEIAEAKEEYHQLQEEVADNNSDLQGIKDKLKDIQAEIKVRSENISEEFEREVYLEFSELNYKQEFGAIERQLAEVQGQLEKIRKQIQEAREEKRRNQSAFENLEYQLQPELEDFLAQVEALTKEEWAELNASPKKILRQELAKLDQVEDNLAEQEQLVRKNFENYINRLKNSNNPQIRQFIKNVEQIMQQGKIYNYDYVESRFLNILETFAKYKENYKREQEENKKNLKILAERSFRRVKVVYESIIELPKNSRIKIYDRNFQVIKIDWEATLGAEGEEKIYAYLEQILDDLQQLKEEGADDDSLDKNMKERLEVHNLINIIAPIEECRIRVWKPRSEEVIRQSQLDYFDWSAVARWSGGESYSVYMTMFMVLVSYIRKQIAGRSDVRKTIIADNPFGKASSAHILNTVFEIAAANKIQLVCLTAHRQESILLRFPVAYSLQLRSVMGREVMQHDRLESGFYNLSGADE
jgi:chromosome segregation ATPase